MPLNVPILQQSILAAFKSTQTAANPEAAQLQLSANLANAIYAFILTANPIPVATAGSAAAQIGAATIS